MRVSEKYILLATILYTSVSEVSKNKVNCFSWRLEPTVPCYVHNREKGMG